MTKRDKDIYNPKYDDGQGKPGTKVEIPVTEENGKPIPADTKFESDTPGITVDDKGKVTVTIPEDKNPGDEITGKVTVTYPDGSKEEIPVKVTVMEVSKNGDLPNPIDLPKLIITKWIDEDGNELKPADAKNPPEFGESNEAYEHGEIPGYKFIRTEINTDGDVVTHIFRKVGINNFKDFDNSSIKENSNILKSTKRLANTGKSETNTGLAGLGLAVLGSLLAIAKKRKEEEE